MASRGGRQVLVLGGGAREHALAWRLARDETVARVRIAPGSAGTSAVADPVADLDILDPAAVARHAARERYDLVVIGPEAPLAAGVADALTRVSVPVFGPSRSAARLESSKAYAKHQLQRAGVPTAAFASFEDAESAIAWARAQDRPPVVKADWLAQGKGVVVADTTDEAEAAIRDLLAGAAGGARLVLEERLSGPEVSAFALVSGSTVVPLAAARDFKRLRDGDVGPNTGGMGAISPVPGFGSAELERSVAEIFEPIAWAMERDGNPYRGVLYAGLMLTAAGPTVLEFNVRFGDPEAQVLLPLLEGDLFAALLGAATGDRGAMEGSLALRHAAAVGVVVASAGYPGTPRGGAISGIDPSGPADAGPLLCFHAATKRNPAGGYEAVGGRVVTFVGLGASATEARDVAYRGAGGCLLEGAQFRTDIGAALGGLPG